MYGSDRVSARPSDGLDAISVTPASLYGCMNAINRTVLPPRFWIRHVGSFGSRITPPIHGPRFRVASERVTSIVSSAINQALAVGVPGLTVPFGGIITNVTR